MISRMSCVDPNSRVGPYVDRLAMHTIVIKRIQGLSRSSGPFFKASKWVQIVVVISCIAKRGPAITLLMLAIGPRSGIQRQFRLWCGV
ncbi:hypothetical protein PAXRUDRAFT_372978 [Paxillus rubicundulus Ve08.2h10]|uniref:Uncharacterized protein n=1 Tax=Paxillus rubicundulus Ve08.2h10 TaxID=930991 RepID=A0A0D0DRH2_9AGAM|nr:hypothetical protein PAXRUDRAFT_372978 [Paxillus rubicundulus Ve08.2h10]